MGVRGDWKAPWVERWHRWDAESRAVHSEKKSVLIMWMMSISGIRGIGFIDIFPSDMRPVWSAAWGAMVSGVVLVVVLRVASSLPLSVAWDVELRRDHGRERRGVGDGGVLGWYRRWIVVWESARSVVRARVVLAVLALSVLWVVGAVVLGVLCGVC